MSDRPGVDTALVRWARGVLVDAYAQSGLDSIAKDVLALSVALEAARQEADRAFHGRDLARLDTKNEQVKLAAAEAEIAGLREERDEWVRKYGDLAKEFERLREELRGLKEQAQEPNSGGDEVARVEVSQPSDRGERHV